MNAETLDGVVLAAISFALTVLAPVQLGKSFAVTLKANDLVTHGLHSRLQHPMYVFVDLTLCGIALALHYCYVLLLGSFWCRYRSAIPTKSAHCSEKSSERAMRSMAVLRGFRVELSVAVLGCARGMCTSMLDGYVAIVCGLSANGTLSWRSLFWAGLGMARPKFRRAWQTQRDVLRRGMQARRSFR